MYSFISYRCLLRLEEYQLQNQSQAKWFFHIPPGLNEMLQDLDGMLLQVQRELVVSVSFQQYSRASQGSDAWEGSN
jgi:hypothetical protein